MDIEKTIDLLKIQKMEHCEKCGYPEGSFYECNYCKYAGPIYMAIEALEKSIPQKPLRELNNAEYKGDSKTPATIAGNFCPNCFRSLDTHYKDCNYCNNCGQKIDWSE